MPDPLPIAVHDGSELALLPALANRHGLITGATGTGKTVTLQVIAERMSAIGVPVFMADVKGDLSGISQPGAMSPKFAERLKLLGVDAPQFAVWAGLVDGAGLPHPYGPSGWGAPPVVPIAGFTTGIESGVPSSD